MVANPHRGEVEFEAGGETHILRFSTNAQCALEEDFGVGLGEVLELLRTEPKVTTVRRVIRHVLSGDYTLE